MTVTLYQGDCLEILKTLPTGWVDAIITDPPYGLGIKYTSFNDTQLAIKELAQVWLPEARRIAPIVAFSCGKLNEWCYPRPTWVLGWASKSGQGGTPWGFPCYWPILVYGRDPYLARRLGRRPDTLFLSSAKPFVKKDKHPCAKPIEVMQWLIERVDPSGNATILDPFMGSGTTGVACVRTGRNFIGIEKDAGYFATAKQNIIEAQAQMSLLAPELSACAA